MKWEYKIITTDDMNAECLNQEGAQGWEHYYVLDNIFFYFKRPYGMPAAEGRMPKFETPPAPAKQAQGKSNKRK